MGHQQRQRPPTAVGQDGACEESNRLIEWNPAELPILTVQEQQIPFLQELYWRLWQWSQLPAYPATFGDLLGGINGGQLYGKSDAAGHSVNENGVTPAAFNATIASALGLPLEEVITSPTGRPFTVAHKGKPVAALLS